MLMKLLYNKQQPIIWTNGDPVHLNMRMIFLYTVSIICRCCTVLSSISPYPNTTMNSQYRKHAIYFLLFTICPFSIYHTYPHILQKATRSFKRRIGSSIGFCYLIWVTVLVALIFIDGLLYRWGQEYRVMRNPIFTWGHRSKSLCKSCQSITKHKTLWLLELTVHVMSVKFNTFLVAIFWMKFKDLILKKLLIEEIFSIIINRLVMKQCSFRVNILKFSRDLFPVNCAGVYSSS